MDSKTTSFLPIGTELSFQYKIVRHIGMGGFGKTYLVIDKLNHDKEVVMKEFYISNICTRGEDAKTVSVNPENLSTFNQLRERFVSEAMKISRLNHTHIVKVTNLIEANNTVYYVMEYVKGMALSEMLKRNGKLDEAKMRTYLDQLLDALEYIHSRQPEGIMHLDIKPANIMIDENDNVVLIDFGASKSFNATSVNNTLLSTVGLLYTPGYAPSEQENGNLEDLGTHCDIYAVGATLYKALSGSNPPKPYDINKKGLPKIEGISQQMWQAIKKAMEYDYDNRIKTVAEFRAMLGFESDSDLSKYNGVNAESNILESQVASDETKISQTTQSTKITEQKTETVNEFPKQPVKQETSTIETENKQKKKKRWSILIGISIVIVLVAALVVVFINYEKVAEHINYENNTITVPGTDISYKMIKVEGGTFQMGSNDSESDSDERPVHSVTLDDYYIGETEITQELWEAVMGTNPSSFSGSNKPVGMVSWDDCQDFIEKLNEKTGKKFRLPTEAEWGFAARGGNKSQGYKYAGSNTIGEVAWYKVNAYDVGKSSPAYGTHSVGTKSPNELGLYDMSGNVWEWCSDCYSDSYYSSSPSTNPMGPSSRSEYSNCVLRGGGCGSNAQSCRVSNRNDCSQAGRYFSYGFRLAL